MSGADISERIVRYGSVEPEPEAILLKTGALTVEFLAGNLRDIRFQGLEVIRAIGYIVRDKDWGTYAPVLSDLKLEEGADSFEVSYNAKCSAIDGSLLRYSASIFGGSDGRLRFDVDATPVGDFQTNRRGFCVLHPIVGVAGSPVVVEHVDGSRVDARMPDLIDPWQPFKQMRAITHVVRPGLQATCRLEGDAFEMEDQRNWSDASYKTYVRPLELPWPCVLPHGQPMVQSVSLTLDGGVAAAPAPPRGTAVEVAIGNAVGTAPKTGLIVTPEEAVATLAQIGRMREIGPQLLTFHFDPIAGHGREALGSYVDIARNVTAETTLECVLPCREDPFAELAAIARTIAEIGLRLDAISVSPSVDRQSTPPGSLWPECPPLEQVYAAARAAFPGLRLGGGSFSYFTELNRKRPPVDLIDFVTHATCPIVHAADDRSVMQTLEALPFVTRSTRAFIGEAKPYRIGPSTIAMRQNPYGSRTFDNPFGKRLAMANADPRYNALYGAAWTFGYAARTVEARLEALTMSALTGPFGLLDGKRSVRPLFHVVRALAATADRETYSVASSSPESIQGLAVAAPKGGKIVWLANLTDGSLAIRLRGANPATMQSLDEGTWVAASTGDSPPAGAISSGLLMLAPFAIVRIDETG